MCRERQTFVASRRMAAPVQPAAAAAAALSAATAIPPPTSVQQKLEQLQARSDKRYGTRAKPPHHDYPPEDDEHEHEHDDGEGECATARRRRDRLAVVTSVRCTNQRALRSAGPEGETAAERRLRRRRTRWMGSEHDKTFIPGLPTVLPSTLTKEQEDQYLREYHHHHTKKQPVSQKKYLF